MFLNSAWPVSLTGDRFALRSLHQSFISSFPLACPFSTAFVIIVEQLRSLTWVQAMFLWAYITFVDPGHQQDGGYQRYSEAVLTGSQH